MALSGWIEAAASLASAVSSSPSSRLRQGVGALTAMAADRIAEALGERLAPGVEVLERAPGWLLHQLEVHPEDGEFSDSPTGRAWASRGLQIASRDLDLRGPAQAWQMRGTLPGPWIDRGLEPLVRAAAGTTKAGWPPTQYATDLVQLALRSGVHQLQVLPASAKRKNSSPALLVGVRRKLLIRNGLTEDAVDRSGAWSVALHYRGFSKPTRRGLLVDREGRVWVAQYALNRQRQQAIHLWCSVDGGISFDIAHTFPAGAVRHIHFIQQDPLDGSLWMGTGDRNPESALWRSLDGKDWQQVGGGSQQWRAIGLAFGRDAITWGTDAGLDAAEFSNCVMRFDRRTGQVQTSQVLQGPVHGISALPGDGVLLTTGCEGGRNETDARVHLWHGSPEGQWRELASWRRGLQPRRVQYAVAHLVEGQQFCSDVWVQLRGTAAMPLGYVRLRLD